MAGRKSCITVTNTQIAKVFNRLSQTVRLLSPGRTTNVRYTEIIAVLQSSGASDEVVEKVSTYFHNRLGEILDDMAKEFMTSEEYALIFNRRKR